MRARWVQSDVSWIVVLGLATQVMTVVSGPLVARMLGPTGRGDMTMVMVITVICAHLSTTSLSNAIASTVARHGRAARDVVGADVRRWAPWSLVPAAASCVAALLLLRAAHSLGLLVVECFVITLLACWLNIVAGMSQGEHAAKRVVWIRAAGAGTYVSCVVVLFLAGTVDIPAYVLPCQIAAQCLALVLNIRGLRPATPGRNPTGVGAEVRTMARQSYVSNLGATDMLGLDSLLVGLLLGHAVLGLYGVAASATTLPGIVVGGLATTLLARMSARTPVAAAALMRRWLLAGLGVTAVMVIGMEVVIGPALRIFFGHDFVPATRAAQILVLAAGVSGIRFMLAAAAQAQGKAVRASAIDLMSGLVLVAAMTLGAQLHGLEGAALAVLATGLFKVISLVLVISWTGRGAVSELPRRMPDPV